MGDHQTLRSLMIRVSLGTAALVFAFILLRAIDGFFGL